MNVVDLGTNVGQTLNEFSRKYRRFFPKDCSFLDGVFEEPTGFSSCLGVDQHEKYRADLEGVGASFEVLDLSESSAVDTLPESAYCVMSKVLHHLGTFEAAEYLFSSVLTKAQRGVWVRALSFEQDDQPGEGVLRKYDLRFGWSTKYVHCPIQGLVSLVDLRKWDINLLPAKRIRHTNDYRVLPIGSDPAKEEYEEVMGHKPQHHLFPEVVSEWDIFIGKKHAD